MPRPGGRPASFRRLYGQGAYTGREQVLVFNGKYHGHIDDTMAETGHSPMGFTREFGSKTAIVEFNDLAAVENALKRGSFACILTEPALTNCGVIHPQPGFLSALESLCTNYACLLIIDETHTQVCAWGGLLLCRGLQEAFDRHGLPWRAQQLFSRSGYTFGPQHPVSASEFSRFHDPLLYNTMRVYYANRGVWESISSAGPAVSFVMEGADVDSYLAVADAFLAELVFP